MTRLDQLLVQRELANSRTHAKKLIDAGRVMVSDGGTLQPARKAGQSIPEDCALEVTPYRKTSMFPERA
ncbi:S4 domain-containing protein [Microbulbifer sp. MKSA007]|nr:S4 domain-containing protein [Microbulbifer sp. MKSA007]